MRKLFTFVALVALVFGALAFTGAPAVAKDFETISTGALDTLLVGTSAVLDTTLAVSIKKDMALVIDIEVLSGGGSGAGYVKVQGRVASGYWIDLPLVDLSDSCAVVINAAFSGTASLAKYVLIGKALPLGLDTTDYFGAYKIAGTAGEGTGYAIINDWLPIDKVRAIISDTNWNASAALTGTWVYKQ